MEDKNIMKTGTTTVGIVSKECIILAADKRATAGNFIADKKVEKVVKINDYMALTTAGSVSDIQLIVKLIRAELKLKEIRAGRRSTIKEAANLLAGIVYQSIRGYSMIPGIVHFIFAGADQTGVHMYDIYPDGSVSSIDTFVASGSGSMFAYGLFETQYKADISKQNAIDLAVKAVNAAIQRDSASGEGIDVVSIDANGVKKELSKRLIVAL
ncbi:MAG: proteasome subunit beta [Nanoarchaeota archaeon]|nr:proteasome subunit beta [Nanoarchaeota archaeon]